MTTTVSATTTTRSYYALLGLAQDATAQQIKQAYHRLLLVHHPDKQRRGTAAETTQQPPEDSAARVQYDGFDAAVLTAAYAVLSSEDKKREYDERLREGSADDLSREDIAQATARRPAEVISLDDFSMSSDEKGEVWTYPSRCGGLYRIREQDMEMDVHLLECAGCSEVVWVEYEETEEDIADLGAREGHDA